MQKNGSEIMEFKKGIKDSIPVGLGYFAVSFSLGIIAKNVGLSPIQGFLTSLFINASAGEYAVFLMISTHGTFIQMVIMTLVSNARYFLMSFALSQKIEEKTNLLHRMCIGFDLTDELFGLAINHEGKVNHKYIPPARRAPPFSPSLSSIVFTTPSVPLVGDRNPSQNGKDT